MLGGRRSFGVACLELMRVHRAVLSGRSHSQGPPGVRFRVSLVVLRPYCCSDVSITRLFRIRRLPLLWACLARWARRTRRLQYTGSCHRSSHCCPR